MQIATTHRARNDAVHCGDVTAWWRVESHITLCIVDGLGHGEPAEQVAKLAIRYVADHVSDPLEAIFSGCDAALRRTRGVAMGLAVINDAQSEMSVAGVGNTRTMFRKGGVTKVFTSDAGIVGGGYGALHEKTVSLADGNLVILVSDGIKQTADVDSYHDIRLADPESLAIKILDDWHTGTDDAAVLVYKHESPL